MKQCIERRRVVALPGAYPFGTLREVGGVEVGELAAVYPKAAGAGRAAVVVSGVEGAQQVVLVVRAVGKYFAAVLVEVGKQRPVDGGVAERCLAAVLDFAGYALYQYPFKGAPEVGADAAGNAVPAGDGLDEDVADGQGWHNERRFAKRGVAGVLLAVGEELVAQGGVIGAFAELVHGRAGSGMDAAFYGIWRGA